MRIKRAQSCWHQVTGHMVSEKTKFVLDGHKTADPVGSTYAGTVSRESARIALTYTALNNHDIFAAET